MHPAELCFALSRNLPSPLIAGKHQLGGGNERENLYMKGRNWGNVLLQSTLLEASRSMGSVPEIDLPDMDFDLGSLPDTRKDEQEEAGADFDFLVCSFRKSLFFLDHLGCHSASGNLIGARVVAETR